MAGQIQSEMGEILDWQPLEGKKATRIAIFRQDENPADTAAWPRQHEWMLSQMTKFKKAFARRLKAINVADILAASSADRDDESGA